MAPDELAEIEGIKAAKYRYVRAVDTRDWDLLATVLTEDATAAYASGKLSYEGRDAIIAFLRESMPPAEMLTSHRVHQPEIELTSPTTATGTWGLDDVVIFPNSNLALRGAAFYYDQYRKVDGEWKISHTGYRRLYEETSGRDGATLTDHWWAADDANAGT
jgi:ketosteroid isomerase-like protein